MKKIRDATTLIGMLERGELAEELSNTLVDTLRTLKDIAGGKKDVKAKGEVSLKLSLAVDGDAVTIHAEVSSKTPKAPRGSSFFFVTDDGEITTEHPRQRDMFGPREAELPARSS